MRKFVIIVFFILIGVILIVATLPRISDRPTKYTMASALSNCRLLSLSIKQYYLDQKSLGKEDIPSPTIPLLLRQNYLDKNFFEKLQKAEGTYVIYFSDSSAAEEPLVQYYCTKGIAEMNTEGEGRLYTWKTWEAQQGAAANP